MTDPIRVLLVVDHPLLRLGLARTLGDSPDIRVVGEFGEVKAVRAVADPPSVFVLAMAPLRQRTNEAIELAIAARPLVRRWPGINAVFLVSSDDGTIARAAEDVGA